MDNITKMESQMKKLLRTLAVSSVCLTSFLVQNADSQAFDMPREVSSLGIIFMPGMCAANHLTPTYQICEISGSQYTPLTELLVSNLNIHPPYSKYEFRKFNDKEIRAMLMKESSHLHMAVINKVMSSLKCASQYNINHNNILTIIDYSLPSSEKRLWVFDLNERQLLFHTYVSHGIKSGARLSNMFSNKNNSKATSIGIYTTEASYYGRDGISLRLDGLDRGFNDNASSRSIVMHGGWYVQESFIKKYGRAGRSWGCPAVPNDLTKSIINTIKDKSLFVAYYPSDSWFKQSRFLKCDRTASNEPLESNMTVSAIDDDSDNRDDVLIAESNSRKQQLDTRAVLAISAREYERIFHTQVPLTRMLRRQIDSVEYIALSTAEFKNMVNNKQQPQAPSQIDELSTVQLINPVVKMHRGYYATQMEIVNLGKIINVKLNQNASAPENVGSYTLQFEKKATVNLRPTSQFIRWLGL
jgi:hypothetical protein